MQGALRGKLMIGLQFINGSGGTMVLVDPPVAVALRDLPKAIGIATITCVGPSGIPAERRLFVGDARHLTEEVGMGHPWGKSLFWNPAPTSVLKKSNGPLRALP
jgi:hypothetical protein